MYPSYYPPPQEDVERVAKTVLRLLERGQKQKNKAKEAEEKKAAIASQRMMSALEWFILGLVLQPIIYPLYNLAINHATALVK